MGEGPDKGRAWVVAVAALVINMIMASIFRAQGLMFVEFISTYGVDRKGASMPFSIRTAIRNLLAPAAGILGQRYGAPTVIAVGGILGSLSSALCYFAPDILWITIVWGCINGISSALITVLPQAVVSQYFVKYRTTATGMSFSGSSIASFVFPLFLDMILHMYGLNGTFLILAGLILHTVPAGMILKKPPWLKENDRRRIREDKIDKRFSKGDGIQTSSEYEKSSKGQKMCDCAVQVGNDKIFDLFGEKLTFRDTECKPHTVPRKRSFSYSGLTHQMQLQNMQRSTIFPRTSSIELNYRSFTSNPQHIFDIDMDYLKRNSDLVFHMLSMELPNVEISYRAILLEIEQDDLWHPEQNEIMQEICSIYCHIEKSLEIDEISNTTLKLNGLYPKRSLLNGALTMSKKSESLRGVKRYFKTYKERGLQQLGKIRSAPNMSNVYNEIARKDYVISKLKQLCNSNEIRIVSHLCQYNPKDVLKVLFQIRTLYKVYNDLESSDQSDSSEPSGTVVERGDILTHRHDSCIKQEIKSEKVPDPHTNTILGHIKAAINLHRNAMFLLICCTRAAFFISFNPVITTLVDFAMDRGLQEDDGKFIIGALSVGDLLGRLGLGWITDRGYASLPRYMLVVMVILGVCTASMPLMHSRWSIFLSIAVFGMLQGSLFIRHPLLVAKYLRPQEQSIAVGCMEFFFRNFMFSFTVIHRFLPRCYWFI